MHTASQQKLKQKFTILVVPLLCCKVWRGTVWIQYNSVNVKVMLIWVAQVSVSVNLLSAEGNRIYVRMIRYYKSLFH